MKNFKFILLSIFMLFLVASLANAFYCDDGNEKEYSQQMAVFEGVTNSQNDENDKDHSQQMAVFEGVTNSQMKSYKESQGFYCSNFLRNNPPSLHNTFTKENQSTHKVKGKSYSPI